MKKLRTSPATGFTIYVGSDPIVVCPLSSSKLAQLRKANTTITRGVEKIDGSSLTKDIFDQTVKSWGPEIVDENGQPLPCTSEVKRNLCEYDSGFVNEVLAEMEEVEKARRNGERGNSKPGPTGTSLQDE